VIRRDTESGWILITQKDHSVLSGEIMKYWGNDKFNTPEPYDEVLLAVAEHDSGWEEWEKQPKINPENKYPKNFLEMNYTDQVAIWTRSFDKYKIEHPYTSALIALHFDKFNTIIAKKNPQALILKNDIKRLVTKNLSLDNQTLSADIINNLKFLQIGDIISLALCHGWRSSQLDEIPYRLNGGKTSMLLESIDGFNYKIFPYPFSSKPVKASVNGRILNKKTFRNNYEFFEAYESSTNTNLNFCITD